LFFRGFRAKISRIISFPIGEEIIETLFSPTCSFFTCIRDLKSKTVNHRKETKDMRR